MPTLATRCRLPNPRRGARPVRSAVTTTLVVVMGLQSFEHGVERMVEGVFSRSSRSTIRPVELGRRLLREMDDHRSVDVKGRRMVPNSFEFHLSARDHAGFADIDQALQLELCEAAREYARDEGYHFVGPVVVELVVDNDLRAGRFGILSQLKEAGGGRGAGAVVLPSGERITLGDRTISIGRLPDCQIPLNDTNVSRRHAEIRAAGSGFVAVDLGSTNGTKVNGVRIAGERVLSDGDTVTVGATHLRFEAS